MYEAWCNFTHDLLKVICHPITGYAIGFGVSVYLLYWQFKRSTGGNRITNVANATREIINKLQNTSDSYTGYLQNKFRFSLGVPIDWCGKTFGAPPNLPTKPNHYPPVVDLGGVDRWKKFRDNIRPVIEDVNPYSFLGWIPFNRRLKRLRKLVILCNAFEDVVMELDAVIQIQENNNIVIVKAEDPGFVIETQAHPAHKIAIEALLNKYAKLEVAWQCWLKVV